MYKKCDARAELLFCLLNLVFLDNVASLDLKVPIDVVDVNCQNWRFTEYTRSWMTGNEVPKTILTGFTCPSLPSSLAVLAHLFSMCVPYYLGAWNRPYLILQNVLCDRIYNTRHKSWNTCVIFPFPNVDLGITVVSVLQNTRGSALGKEWGTFEGERGCQEWM